MVCLQKLGLELNLLSPPAVPDMTIGRGLNPLSPLSCSTRYGYRTGIKPPLSSCSPRSGCRNEAVFPPAVQDKVKVANKPFLLSH